MTRFRILLLGLLVASFLAASAAPAFALNPEQRRPDGVTGLMTPSLNDFWSQKFASMGKPYVAPTAISWYTTPTQSLCGMLQPGNSYFCGVGSDRRLFLDWAWHWSLLEQFGDYSSGFVFAHEWGHHVQDQLGWMSWAMDRGYYAGRELQADCYAGIYTRHAYNVGLVNQGDYDEALTWLDKFGDNFHWKHPYAHGQSWLRKTSFEYGFEYMSLAGCDLVYRRLYGNSAAKSSAPKPPKKPAKPKKRRAARR
jgi:predicted metalloprotease